MSDRLDPARPVVRPDGIVESPAFGDVYQPARDGSQARAVFLAGNGLPGRWADRADGAPPFVLLELGVGTALNLRETLRAWLDAGRPTGVRYVGLDGAPLTRDELAQAADARAGAEPGDLDRRIVEAWPEPQQGWHRWTAARGRRGPFEVELWHGEFLPGLQQLAAVDACFLDGFAPAKNGSAWRPAVLEQVGRLVVDGGTAATWCVAGAVRRGLEDAGFEVERLPGHGRKRHRLEAVRRPRSEG